MEIIDKLRPLLQTKFQRDLFEAALVSAHAVENPLRLNNFSTAFRELVRDVFDHLAPNEQIKRCSWYVPDPTSATGVTRAHRVSFVIHGGLAPEFTEEELHIDVQGEQKQLVKAGDAEFILMEALYSISAPGCGLDADGVHVISVDGTSFKRYLELAKLLGIKVAAIRDNDKDHAANCVANYLDHVSPSIQVFADPDNARHTFEVCMYQDNKTICHELFEPGRKTLSVEEYMLKNKTDAAFQLLETKGAALAAPGYIQRAVAWIRA